MRGDFVASLCFSLSRRLVAWLRPEASLRGRGRCASPQITYGDFLSPASAYTRDFLKSSDRPKISSPPPKKRESRCVGIKLSAINPNTAPMTAKALIGKVLRKLMNPCFLYDITLIMAQGIKKSRLIPCACFCGKLSKFTR